jgi:hypothetical protein
MRKRRRAPGMRLVRREGLEVAHPAAVGGAQGHQRADGAPSADGVRGLRRLGAGGTAW